MSEQFISPFIEYRLRLKGDPIQGMQKPPTFGVDVRKNGVTFTAWTGGKDGEGRNANIKAPLDAFSFSAVCVGLQNAINFRPTPEKPDFAFRTRCYTPRKRNPGETGLPRALAATIVVGKDKNGCVYISVLKKDPPHIKFIFRPSEYHEIVADNGQLEDQAAVSVVYAQAWLEIIRPFVEHCLVSEVDDWRSEANGGGNNNQQNNNNNQRQNNNYQNNNSGGGGGGYQNNNNTGGNDGGFDEDIPL